MAYGAKLAVWIPLLAVKPSISELFLMYRTVYEAGNVRVNLHSVVSNTVTTDHLKLHCLFLRLSIVSIKKVSLMEINNVYTIDV